MMRKFLLASAAVMGLTTGMTDVGFAQSDDSGQAATPAPGTITVRLNGRVRVYAGLYGESDESAQYYYDPLTGTARETPFYVNGSTNAAFAGGAPTTGAGSTLAVAPGFRQAVRQTNKTSDYGLNSYARLFPGFDGVAANGLKYGASLEIRQDNNSGAGGRGGVYGSISQQSREKGQLYFRREWGYLGTDKLGTFRFGATDGPSGLFLTGNFENFNDGGWNGDVPSFINGSAQVTWPFADQGELYTTTKIVYLSPQFYGFDFGIAYEPNTSNITGDGSTGCNAPQYLGYGTNGSGPGVSGAGCDRLSSTTTADYRRRKNTVDVAARYRGTFGPVGVAAFVNYIGGGRVGDATGANAQGTGIPGGPGNGNATTNRLAYDGLSVGVGGATVTYAGLTVGGLVQGGRFNSAWATTPKGSADSFAWLVGASYTFGPVIVGASYFDYNSPGASSPAASNTVGRLRQLGAAAGGTYSLAPGVALYLSYLWGQSHEGGQDLLLGNANSSQGTPAGLHNTVNSQALVLGTSFTW